MAHSDLAIASPPLIHAVAAIVLAASLSAGGIAIVRDLRVAFRDAGPSNVPASVARQLDAVRQAVPAGEPVLLVSGTLPEELWYARLVQRVLYPRHHVLIRYLPFSRDAADALRRRWAIRFGLAMDVRPPDIGFLTPDDLGTLPAVDHHVWLGALAPP
jgi:hypothetical protein